MSSSNLALDQSRSHAGENAPHKKRKKILPIKNQPQPAIPWHSWVLLVCTLGGCGALVYSTYGLVMAAWLRWVVSAGWVAGAFGMGIYDYLFHAGTPGSTDAKPLDRWSIVHAMAGLVFGVWFLPIWVVLVLAIGWEVFEWKVTGFGDQEIITNRAVDVGVALFGWLLVVGVAMGTTVTGAAFPFLHAAG